MYRDTWHNLGFRVVDRLADGWGCTFKAGKGEYFLAETTRHSGVSLLKPTSYMNRSGGPVSAWLRYFKVEPGRMLVVYDDHDLPLGRIRLRENGSAGGHHGIEDIIRLTGTDAFPRIRIGIRLPNERPGLADQVLSIIPAEHLSAVEVVVKVAVEAAEFATQQGILAAMNRYNGMEI